MIDLRSKVKINKNVNEILINEKYGRTFNDEDAEFNYTYKSQYQAINMLQQPGYLLV